MLGKALLLSWRPEALEALDKTAEVSKACYEQALEVKAALEKGEVDGEEVATLLRETIPAEVAASNGKTPLLTSALRLYEKQLTDNIPKMLLPTAIPSAPTMCCAKCKAAVEVGKPCNNCDGQLSCPKCDSSLADDGTCPVCDKEGNADTTDDVPNVEEPSTEASSDKVQPTDNPVVIQVRKTALVITICFVALITLLAGYIVGGITADTHNARDAQEQFIISAFELNNEQQARLAQLSDTQVLELVWAKTSSRNAAEANAMFAYFGIDAEMDIAANNAAIIAFILEGN